MGIRQRTRRNEQRSVGTVTSQSSHLICHQRVCLFVSILITFRHMGKVSIWVPSALEMGRWQCSENLTATHTLAAVALTTNLMSVECNFLLSLT